MNDKRSLIVALALGIDAALRDPPNRLHPVAWMGSAIGWLTQRAPKTGNGPKFVWGALIALGGAGGCALVGAVLERAIRLMPSPLDHLAEALILKMVFSLNGLASAAGEVEGALRAGDLPEARRLVSWHLVSRDTSALDEGLIAAATVESVAENASDGVLGPLVYYALGGLPAALAYRYLNTADSMLGYRDEAREWLGKAPARLDDLANLLPARLTALMIVGGAAIGGADAGKAIAIWQRDRGVTESPNAGHPMSAMAGALGVELEKVGHYKLGAGLRRPDADDVARSVRLIRIAAALFAALLVVTRLLSGKGKHDESES